ncbi:16S rRNA (cytosine(1402)-N(4))-methyltransferase RsmH [Haloglycomyces albus]|uniref:16S rRNA (cytosine(1402)-N(4))-methyltransferase RsmH n=1 Tax=Haloglycomyces albus TaxID=526067 RepID=UPI00046CB263|nr:16S rRNA (cytosine(1402)-N(4))-methyltransferase RsmH [Haloglycomyces albus]
MNTPHDPVMLEEILAYLHPALSTPEAIAVDATLGAGGHAEAMLTAHPELTVIGLDRDPNALSIARERLAAFGDRFIPVQSVYDQIDAVVRELGHTSVHAVLFDLGISSMQIDERERGFAYSAHAPLDMRMNPGDYLTAERILATYDHAHLTRILREYGEEKFAPRIASAIVNTRDTQPIVTSQMLVELIREAIPAAARRKGGNPAKRTFQALRIEVNGELDTWTRALPVALDLLRPGGRIAVLSYHSLEDRITKRALAERAKSTTPPGLPVELPGTGPQLKPWSNRAKQPGSAERARNPRSAPARLRGAEKLDNSSPGG